jgi:hypothetical protein
VREQGRGKAVMAAADCCRRRLTCRAMPWARLSCFYRRIVVYSSRDSRGEVRRAKQTTPRRELQQAARAEYLRQLYEVRQNAVDVRPLRSSLDALSNRGCLANVVSRVLRCRVISCLHPHSRPPSQAAFTLHVRARADG